MRIFRILEKMTEKLKEPRWLLLSASILLTAGLIVFGNVRLLPMRTGDFIFFSIITLALGIYRPGWLFLLLVSFLSLENINLVPAEWSLKIRPYQFLALILTGAILIRLLVGKLKFKLVFPKQIDFILLAMGVGSLLSALSSAQQGNSLKLTLILLSFFILYLLARNFIQTPEDVQRIAPFFLASSLVVIGYGIWQNIRFLNNLANFEIMPGRPNATFTEPDWLGIYLVITISLAISLIYYFSNKITSQNDKLIFRQLPNHKFLISKVILYFFLTLNFTLLIITVARSAWLGTATSIFIFLFVTLTQLRFNFNKWHWKFFWLNSLGILISLVLALGIVHFLPLTNFQLLNRVQSTASGLQKITVSCESETSLPKKLTNDSELEKYGCRHINLEDIEKERQAEKFITETYRDDPNVNVRAQIYQKSWSQIKQHFIFGIGWGSINEIFGRDERGSSLNASNIFLEIWLGSGLIGIIAFLIFWAYILIRNIKNFISPKGDILTRSIALFLIVSWFGFTMANLFNSGIMLGFLWLFLATSLVKSK